MAEKYSVAIDGPSGAGKSTLAKAAAAALGICYVDTGAIYRTIGYGVYRRGINPSVLSLTQRLTSGTKLVSKG